MSSFVLPRRTGEPPVTGKQPPQLQFSDQSPREIYKKMSEWFFSTFEHAREEPTRISVPTSRALWLDESINAPSTSFMPPPGSREFAHLHEDGSFHLVMAPEDEAESDQQELGTAPSLERPWRERNPCLCTAQSGRDRNSQTCDCGVLSFRGK